MTEQEKFLKLLEYSNELHKNKKYLIKENPKAFDALLKFLVITEEKLHY